jgi:hypothetical protein
MEKWKCSSVGTKANPIKIRNILRGHLFTSRSSSYRSLIRSLNYCVKCIASYSEYQEVVGLLFLPPKNLFVSNNKVSRLGKLVLRNFCLSLKAFRKVCENSTVFEVHSFGSSYYFVAGSEQEEIKELASVFSGLHKKRIVAEKVVCSKFKKWQDGDLVIAPLYQNEQLLGLILAANPKSGLAPSAGQVLSILAFAQVLLRNYQRILSDNRDFLDSCTNK